MDQLKHNDGFTLIEMLAAMVLAALLMLTVLGLATSIGRSGTPIEKRRDAERRGRQVAALLEWDLASARTIQPTKGGVLLSSCSAVDPRTGLPTQRPARVIYSLKAIEKTTWLLRRQEPLDDTAESWTELICPHVAAFEVRSLENGPWRGLRPRPTEMPPAVLQLTLQFDGLDADGFVTEIPRR